MVKATIDKADLYGAWDLVSWRRVAADGAITHPFTETARGRIIYAPEDWMGVFLMRPDWPQSSGAEGFTAYSGRFAIEGENILHIVDQASSKSLIATTQVRKATLAGGVLRLEAPAADGGRARQVLEWRFCGRSGVAP